MPSTVLAFRAPHPLADYAASFVRYLKAENRSDRTIEVYTPVLRQLRASLDAHGYPVPDNQGPDRPPGDQPSVASQLPQPRWIESGKLEQLARSLGLEFLL
jgi:hypothetical protein